MSRSDLSFHRITGFHVENRQKGNKLEKREVVLRTEYEITEELEQLVLASFEGIGYACVNEWLSRVEDKTVE